MCMPEHNREIDNLILNELRDTRIEINKLNRAITGDPEFGHIGLVQRVNKLEESDADQNKKLIILSSTTAALSSAATFVATYFKDKLFGG